MIDPICDAAAGLSRATEPAELKGLAGSLPAVSVKLVGGGEGIETAAGGAWIGSGVFEAPTGRVGAGTLTGAGGTGTGTVGGVSPASFPMPAGASTVIASAASLPVQRRAEIRATAHG
jgi:hypothetical protein